MKSSIKLLEHSICRVPAFPSAQELNNAWEDLKEMIYNSSPIFYNEIKDLGFKGLEEVDEKTRFTIFKYFNRAKNRSTPFGKFASISLIPIEYLKGENRLVLGSQKVHSYPDWSSKNYVERKLEGKQKKDLCFQVNSTMYLHGDRIKYLFFNSNSFELSSIEYSEPVFTVLDYARKESDHKGLIDFLTSRTSLNIRESYGLINMLIELQLLLPDTQPNIIGCDYFIRQSYDNIDCGPRYIIAERDLLHGTLEKTTIQEVQQSIEWLHRALPVKVNKNLDNFKKQFTEKFGDREIPLAVALDPETGVGYGNLEVDQFDNDLVTVIKEMESKEHSENKTVWTDLNQFLLKGIVNGDTIQSESFEPPEPELPLPNTFSAIVRIGDDSLVIERLGGCTANALLGRFSLAGKRYYEMCQTITAIETEANPDVMFFDIGYMAEERIDNVNRRLSIYNAELSILSYCLADIPVQLDDIIISVVEDQLMLRSQKYNRRLIPRIASAYNYVRSDLSLFRFLADLQHQGINSSLTLDLLKLFPGLAHYPRVKFKNVIISPEKWFVPNEFTQKAAAITEATINALKNWLEENSIDAFSCGITDQKLVFYADRNDDLNAFLRFISGRGIIYIDEYVRPKNSHVTNESSGSFAAEFILVYYHKCCLYKPISESLDDAICDPEKYYLQGHEWVYFEIYCHHASAESILSEYLEPFLRRNRKKIALWFFIRYNSPSHHIRFRFKLKSVSNGYALLADLSKDLEPLLLNLVISDLQLKIYRPEIKRYGADLISLVEQFFCKDSKLAAAAINSKCSNNCRYQLSIQLMVAIFDELKYGHRHRIAFLEKVADAFAAEFKVSVSTFRKINEGFKQYIGISNNRFPNARIRQRFHQTFCSMTKALNSADIEKREKLLVDLFHMHVNRLYNADQRVHELIIYNYLRLMSKRRYFLGKNE